MPSSEDVNGEQEFLARWMSNASRAGVILTPTFPMLESKQDTALCRGLQFTSGLSEDCINEEHHLDRGIVYGDRLGDSQMPPAMHGQMFSVEDVSSEWEHEHSTTDFMPDDDYALGGLAATDPLLQKLEQLKELQQQKQQQLKKQQMEQLHRLMEEQKKLLTMVSVQQSLPEHLEPRSWQSSSPPTAIEGIPTLPSHTSQNVQIGDRFSCSRSPDAQNGLHQMSSGSECSFVPESRLTMNSDSEDHSAKASMSIQNDSEYEALKNNMLAQNDICEKGQSDHSLREDIVTNENHTSEASLLEERPIVSGIKEKKQSFEEFLEEQMRLEEQRLKQKDHQQSIQSALVPTSVVKRTFLKRGEGTARFMNAKSKLSTSKERKLMALQRTSEDKVAHKTDRPQMMQRKTAPSGKDQVLQDVAGIMKKPSQFGKIKNAPATNQKVAVLKNQNMKNKSSKALSGRDSIHPVQFGESNSKLEANKENIMEYVKPSEMGSSIKKNVQTVEKPQTITALMPRQSTAPSNNPEFSFDRSFQKRCKSWEIEKEKEHLELDEFMLLEEAAEDISFSSNSSFVQKLLAQDQQIIKGRRLSSTPVKEAQRQLESLVANKIGQKDHIVHANTKDCAVERQSDFRAASIPLNILKAPPTVDNPILHGTAWETSDEENDCGNSNTSSDSEDFETTMIGEEEEAKQLVMSSEEDNPTHHDFEGPLTNISVENKSRDLDLDLSDREECIGDESTALKCKGNGLDKNILCARVNDMEFDDDRTWADLEKDDHPCDRLDNNATPPPGDFRSASQQSNRDKAITRKIASIKKGDDVSRANIVDSNASAPPTSDLMLKMFPSLKPKQIPDAHQRHESRPCAAPETSTGDNVRTQILKEKLAELETEIEKFKFENASLAKLRADQEKSMENFRKECAEHELRKAKELAQIEEFKKEEIKKLQKERKVFETYATAARAIPDKKERDEIQALKQQLADLHEDLKRRELRWSTTHGRLRNQMESVMKENAELREEVKVMEKFRLEVWKKAEAAENKKADSNVTLKKTELITPTSVFKSQIPSPVLHSEKNIKMTSRMPSTTKGHPAGKPTSTSSDDARNIDVRKSHLMESSVKAMPSISCIGVGQSAPLISGSKGTDEETQGEVTYSDGKVEKILKNGCHVILFPNGTRKEASADGKSLTVTFFNGDVKRVMPDQTVIYYFADAQTTHTTYPDGLEVLHFANGQIEKHYPDGKKEITFPDQTVKNLYLDGREESIFPDGTIIRINLDGSKIIEFDNGQREIHTSQFKRREYPDGTVKTVYSNGNQETKFTSGRVRVKDRDGNVIIDTK
ncbi:centromere protein J [Ambystoma mexicanum]|uniref:centromere protein J n=1 Tax=Ambystoma mexicanum TaxID=8296 RepID=UPI0037E73A4E